MWVLFYKFFIKNELRKDYVVKGSKISASWHKKRDTVVCIYPSHLKNILTSMNYRFINQLSPTYHAPILSQLVCFPSTCSNFVSNPTSSRHSYYLTCKHIYYIYNVCLDLVGDNETHQPSLSWNDVKDISMLDPLDPFHATWCIKGNMVPHWFFGILKLISSDSSCNFGFHLLFVFSYWWIKIALMYWCPCIVYNF